MIMNKITNNIQAKRRILNIEMLWQEVWNSKDLKILK